MKTYKPHASSIGDGAANIIAVACYVFVLLFWAFGVVPLLLILLVEKRSGLVRFHAVQALLFWVARLMLGGGLPYESFAALITQNEAYLYAPMGWMSGPEVLLPRLAIEAVFVVLAGIAMYRAYHWQDWKMPVIGRLAWLVCRYGRPVAYRGEVAVPASCQLDERIKAMDYGFIEEEMYTWASAPPITLEEPAVALKTDTKNADEKDAAVEKPNKNDLAKKIYQTMTQEETERQAHAEGREKEAGKPEKRKAAPKYRRQEKTPPPAVLAKDDPNTQLPLHMRDPIPALEIQECLAGWADRTTESGRVYQVDDDIGFAMATPPLADAFGFARKILFVPRQSRPGSAAVHGAEEEWEKRHLPPQKLRPPWPGKNGQLATQPLPADDPNTQLPPDMRDGPAPVDG